ncbi:MAG: signal peptidase I [Candidatus Cloacimonadaceae bacterium]|jgi:signal peptidase I|nr:signal peptidase I [Candidatus Cloacimonadota bacterium]MDY0319690.1 signal peptidase I [Candidatus Cloacimonadaceae bacterium]
MKERLRIVKNKESLANMPSRSPLPEGKKFHRRKPQIQDWAEAILFAFVVAMIIRNYTFQNFMIPSSSMEKTLLTGDFLVANKLKYYFTDPKREDIVTFRYPKIEEGTPEHPDYKNQFIKIFHPIYINKAKAFSMVPPFTAFHLSYYARKNVVKRVIGMPGDTIELRDKIVYVNGEEFTRGYECYGEAYPSPPLSPRLVTERTLKPGTLDPISMSDWYEPYRAETDSSSTNLRYNRDWFGPIKVPEGKYFVMGDNRDVSEDSRYWGFLERTDITGSPWLIFWSKGIEYNKLYDTPHIRWNRIFRLAK